jgi:predicted nucleic acid-binding protein
VIVLDASALVDVVADRPAKDAVLAHMAAPVATSYASPSHQLAEVLSALARLHRGGELTAIEARQALAEAVALVQQVYVPDEPMLARAFSLRGSIRVLDGLYVALAERLGCPLLTTDGRLVRADPPCQVIFAQPPGGSVR